MNCSYDSKEEETCEQAIINGGLYRITTGVFNLNKKTYGSTVVQKRETIKIGD